MAGTLGGARTGRGAAGAWRRARRRVLGGARVRRRSVGRCAPERAFGGERAPLGAASAARHHGRHARSTRTGEGTLPTDRPAGRQRGNGREHTQAASAADPAPDERPSDGAVYTGRHPAELHATRPDAGTGRDRQQPDRRRGPRAAPAHDAGGQPRGGAAGHPAGWLRRPPARGQGGARRGAEHGTESARGAQVVSLDRGSARLCTSARATAGYARAVHPGPRGRLRGPVRGAARARAAGGIAGPCEGRPGACQGAHGGRGPDHAPPVRGGA